MPKPKTFVLIVNLGTPDSPSVRDVRRYLRQFLMDARVMDIPFWRRFFLVNFIIAPFRVSQLSQAYHGLWTPEGPPLKVYGFKLEKLLQQALGDDYQVKLAMRYQRPGIRKVLSPFGDKGVKQLVVIPLYPQYASSTTGSAIAEVMNALKGWRQFPEVKFVSPFFDRPLFIKAIAETAKNCMAKVRYHHYLFSYHGLPEHEILKSSRDSYCRMGECCLTYGSQNQYCYRAQCFETTRLLVKELGINKGNYTVCFQSRFGKAPWIKPYTDEVIQELPKRGIKKVLVFSPSFTADCLETTVEIGKVYEDLFIKSGGDHLQLVESLNIHPTWVECLKQMVLEESVPLPSGVSKILERQQVLSY